MEAEAIGIKALSLSIVAVLITEMAAQLLLSACPLHPMIVLGGARSIEILLMIQIARKGDKGMAALGLTGSGIPVGLRQGLVWSLGFGFLTAVTFAILLGIGTDPLAYFRSPMPAGVFEMLLLLCVGCIASPIAEEIFFRGLLYGFFRRRGVIVAVILSTGLFVLVHANRPQIPLSQIVGGLVFAVSYEIEGNLMVPITIHILGNAALYALSLPF